MHIIDTRGATIRYPHHKTILFTFPDPQRTTVANKKNWNCDGRIIRAIVLPSEEQLDADLALEEGEEGEESDEESDEGADAPEAAAAGSGAAPTPQEPIPPPPPFHPPFTHPTGESSSSAAYTSLDPTFLQSFSNLQVEVSGLREGFSGMSRDIQRISGRMDSIEEGVSYFRGYVDRQEQRELRRIQREEERAIREAREYEERRRMNELLWRQSESIRQLEERLRSVPGAPAGSSSSPSFAQGPFSHFYPFPSPYWPPPGPDGAQ